MSEPFSEHDRLAREIVDAAFEVHTVLGPGLLRSVYQQYLVYKPAARAISFQRQVALTALYRKHRIDAGLRIDIVTGGLVVVAVWSS